MYFSKFKKNSPGKKLYGRGFVCLFDFFSRDISLIFGIKKIRTTLGYNYTKSNRHYDRYKIYVFCIYTLFLIITLEIRISHKTDKNLFQNLLHRKKKLLH